MKIKETVVIFPDIHFPHHDEKAFSCALEVLEKIKPSAFLLLGDFAEGFSVSHWQWAKKKRPPLEFQLPAIEEEIEQVNHGLDRIDRACKKVGVKTKILTMGNHELWFDNFVEENPYLTQYGAMEAFKIKDRGYKSSPYGKYVKILGSKLYAYHGGHYSGINHTRSHVMNLGVNIIYGHTHDCMKSVVTHLTGAKMAFSMGCLCKMEKDFLKNRQTNWTHNVGLLDIFDDGNFNLNVLTIINGKTSYNGKIINGQS